MFRHPTALLLCLSSGIADQFKAFHKQQSQLTVEAAQENSQYITNNIIETKRNAQCLGFVRARCPKVLSLTKPVHWHWQCRPILQASFSLRTTWLVPLVSANGWRTGRDLWPKLSTFFGHRTLDRRALPEPYSKSSNCISLQAATRCPDIFVSYFNTANLSWHSQWSI